jgi:hypothetical protein
MEAAVTRQHRRTSNSPSMAGLAGVVVLALAAVGCGIGESNEMDADTECREFLQAAREEQDAAIARIADEIGARDALTPLGRPNIDYLCSRDQDRTLGEAVELTG